jgi:hypothetical protein
MKMPDTFQFGARGAPCWLIAAGLLAAVALLSAQAPLREANDGKIRPFWKCRMPSGTFLVPVDRIANVSTHQYVVQGAGRVWEMVVADDSSAVARFYYMEPASKVSNPVTGDDAVKYTEDALKEVTESTDTEEVWRRVVKAYPYATHAHTIEYRFEDRKTLEKVFQHLSECWTTGRPGEIKVGRDPEP